MSLQQVRAILYEVLTADDSDGQGNLDPMIKATQKMGVSLSSAVTREGGVKIFQLQNVVHQKVIRNVVEALKVIDAMPLALPEPQVIDVEPIPEEEDQPKSLGEEIEEALDSDSSYSLFLNMVGHRFILAAITRHETFKETAAAIKISYSKLMQVKRTTL